jgi:hypothetical protein
MERSSSRQEMQTARVLQAAMPDVFSRFLQGRSESAGALQDVVTD